MEKTLAGITHGSHRIPSASFWNGTGWGFLGGLVGTLTMDLILMAVLAAFGLPALTCFSIVGNTVAGFFTMPDLTDAGVIRLGIITHYLVGPLFGAIFGAILAQVTTIRTTNLKKCILWAILYIEILSQPLLATTPIFLKMTMAKIVQWYGGAFLMHLILAVILGLVVVWGLRRTGYRRGSGNE